MGQCQGRDEKVPPKYANKFNDVLCQLEQGKGTPVWVNVYDLLIMNYTTSKFGVGIYHTGVQVYDHEFCFSGHIQRDPRSNKEITGLRSFHPPKDTTWIEDAIFKESILVGYTDLTIQDVFDVFTIMKTEYTGPSYNVLKRNCNHFTLDFLERILRAEYTEGGIDERLPAYINRVVRMANKVRFCLPSTLTTDLRDQKEMIKMH